MNSLSKATVDDLRRALIREVPLGATHSLGHRTPGAVFLNENENHPGLALRIS